MALLKAILEAQHKNQKKCSSPPPETADVVEHKKKHRVKSQMMTVVSKVDCSPPLYLADHLPRNLHKWTKDLKDLHSENVKMVMAIKMAHFKGKVDCRWEKLPSHCKLYQDRRIYAYRKIRKENETIYKRLINTRSRLEETSSLNTEWLKTKARIIRMSQGNFVLFPLEMKEIIDDPAFLSPPNIKRPKVYITIGIRNAPPMGTIMAELFTDICPLTCKLFLELTEGGGYGYVGTRFFRKSPQMLVSESELNGHNDLFVKIVSPDGQVFSAYFPDDTLIEEVKNRTIDFFYPNGENSSSRYKIVRVSDTSTLHDFLTLSQEQVAMYDELLLIERRTPEAGTLWDLGSVRAPQPSAIAEATASLPSPQNAVRQPNLQSLLSTNELSYELRKILISLIEAGARLAAAGRNYELTLAQLSAALDQPQRNQQFTVQVITPEEIAARLNATEETETPVTTTTGDSAYKRAEHLQKFLDKFRAWRTKIIEPPNPEAIVALENLGFASEQADTALRYTGSNVPAAASWLIGERGSSVFELINGLPDGYILQTLLKQPQIQRGLLNTRMLIAFIAMVGQTGSASLWLNSPHGSPLLSHISRTYHSEKYCLAVNQFSEQKREHTPSTSRQR